VVRREEDAAERREAEAEAEAVKPNPQTLKPSNLNPKP